MVELTVGSRFWFGDNLVEVIEETCSDSCVLFSDTKKCNKAKCLSHHRHDGKDVKFVKVEENVDAEIERLKTTPLVDLGLSVRSLNALHRVYLRNVYELTQLTYEQLTTLKNLGKKSAMEVASKLAEMGLSLRKEKENE